MSQELVQTLFWLLAGMAIGWGIEFVIDLFILRPRWKALAESPAESTTSVADELHAMETALARLEERITGMGVAPAGQPDSQEIREALSAISAKLEEHEKLLKELISAPAPGRVTVTEERVITQVQDRLTDIKGIGPVYSGKLHEAGIHTFKQLASLTPDELVALINVPAWRIDAESWIEQARLLASQREKLEAGM